MAKLLELIGSLAARLFMLLFGKYAVTKQDVLAAYQRGQMSQAQALYIIAPPGSLPGDENYDPEKALPLSPELMEEIEGIRLIGMKAMERLADQPPEVRKEILDTVRVLEEQGKWKDGKYVRLNHPD